MVTTVDNKAVATADHKVVVLATAVVAEMVVVVVVVSVATRVVVLVVAEMIKDVVGPTTTLTPNNRMACPGKSAMLTQKHVTMLVMTSLQLLVRKPLFVVDRVDRKNDCQANTANQATQGSVNYVQCKNLQHQCF